MSLQRALPEVFRTSRLLAQRLDKRHRDQLRAFHADPEVMDWLGGVGGAEETDAWLNGRVAEHWQRYGYGLYALFEKHAPCAAGGVRELVGRAGLHHCTIEGGEEVELLYALAPAYQGKGYATEIGGAIVGLALTSLGLQSVVAYTLPHNAASRRVLEKMGFVHERDIVHEDRPHVLYRRTRPVGEEDATPEGSS